MNAHTQATALMAYAHVASRQKLAAQLACHRATLHEVLALSDGSFAMRQLADRARSFLARIDAAERNPLDGPFGSLGKWGPNGYGPTIDNLLSDARSFARREDV